MNRSITIAALGGWLMMARAPLAYQPQLMSPSGMEPTPNADPLFKSHSDSGWHTEFNTPCEACGSQQYSCDCQPSCDCEIRSHDGGWGVVGGVHLDF